MTVKETLVDALQKEGYDLFSACQWADEVIQEFKNRKNEKFCYVYTPGGKKFKITKKG